MKLIDLGWCMARLDTKKEKLTIVSPSASEESVYYPSESVLIYGGASLIALRDALNEAYPVEAK